MSLNGHDVVETVATGECYVGERRGSLMEEQDIPEVVASKASLNYHDVDEIAIGECEVAGSTGTFTEVTNILHRVQASHATLRARLPAEGEATAECDVAESSGSLMTVGEIPEVKDSKASVRSRKRKRSSTNSLNESCQLKGSSSSAGDECEDFIEPLQKSSR